MTARSLPGVVPTAAAAALVLALLSRGDALVLAALLAVAALRLTSLAVLPALVAVSWRWGSTSLDAWAGAQAVLGPAGVVGPSSAAAACWLAALAVVLSTPDGVGGMSERWGRAGAPNVGAGDAAAEVEGVRARWGRTGAPNLGMGAMAVTTGAVGAAIVAGPALGGEAWTRILATVAGALVAAVVGWARRRHDIVRRVGDVLGAVAGLGALALVSADAPAWSGTLDTDAMAAGVLVAAAVGALVAVAAHTAAALRFRRA